MHLQQKKCEIFKKGLLGLRPYGPTTLLPSLTNYWAIRISLVKTIVNTIKGKCLRLTAQYYNLGHIIDYHIRKKECISSHKSTLGKKYLAASYAPTERCLLVLTAIIAKQVPIQIENFVAFLTTHVRGNK